MMRISVIICTYNREEFIKGTVESVLESMRGIVGSELIIIDNNSSDSTSEILKYYINNQSVKYFLETKQGLSHARNRGMTEANGEIIVFLDDDIEVERDYFNVLISVFEDKKVNIIGGKVLPYKVNIPEWLPKKFYYLVSVFHLGDYRKEVRYLMGANYAMRKNVAKQIGEYNVLLGRKGNSLMGGEEVDYLDRARKKGYKAHYIPELIVFHKINNKLNEDYVCNFAFMNGISDAVRYKENDQLKYGLKKIKALFSTFSFKRAGGYQNEKKRMYYLLRKQYSLGYLKEESD